VGETESDLPGIRVEQLRKVYGRVVAVDDVSFTVMPGELVGLVGPNGAGKSTTIRILAGQLVPTSGRIQVSGVDVTADPAGVRARLGFVPEEPRLYDYLNAREMLEFVVQIRGQGDVGSALELAGLGEDSERLIREYSQGMRRKTALACAFVARPPVLILDESLNGLDPPSTERVMAALERVRTDGTAVLLSTHVLDTLERHADRIVMLEQGRVVANAPASELPRLRERFR
jgi:ABC-2 type transport system ATP-binding protein